MDPRMGSIGIIGGGAAGLITAHTLLQDGFADVQILTRDKSVGGVWADERVYPGLLINNVHGEFSFSSLPMPPPKDTATTDRRLSGDDMRAYMEKFANVFLKGKVRFGIEVLNICRDKSGVSWVVHVEDQDTAMRSELKFNRIVLCTGGCSEPYIPDQLSASAAKVAGFRGAVIHSKDFRSQLDHLLSTVEPIQSNNPGSVVVVGGGKSAQDIAAFLANHDRKATVVFETTDAFVASSSPLPNFIRKSRFLSILSPHIELRTRLERFLHTTWLGSKIVHGIWNAIAATSFTAMSVPKDSPLRRTQSLFWGIRTNDNGISRPDGFHALVNAGKIHLVAPARAEKFGEDGHSVVLRDGNILAADALVLATGFSSSWSGIFDKQTADDLGLSRHPSDPTAIAETWDYTSLADPPPAHAAAEQWSSSIYRGIVPARNITRRDFAINGAVISTNNGYTWEVSAHWISSYFLGDKMRIPSSVEEALWHTERNAAWMRKRFPDMLLWANESLSSGIAFWNSPQAADDLLEDMELPVMRSGGNWLTWPFKIVDLKEISTLAYERSAKRV